ncbi:MAG: hypothetical protein M3139_17560 [Bacteroidota bacterium]|nr:hypothetical protein [Bacteroidota bacterium]
MENFYTAYTKVVQNTTLYFVKKYITFPEYGDVPGVLESYGMHADFNKACEIAAVTDQQVRKNLFADLQDNESSAKIIYMDMAKGQLAAK